MNRIMITGVSGFFGWNLFHCLKSRYRILGMYGCHRPRITGGKLFPLDIRDGTAVDRVCREFTPEIIIHAAAVTSPAECMNNKERAREINVTGTENIARAAREKDARLIFISTDRVFDGKKGDYNETDIPLPLGHYGKTKLAGEELVRAITPDYLILRLPLMYGPPSPFHGSFLEFMLEGFRSQSTINLFTDQYRTPLYVEDAGRGIELILDHPELTGLYHLGGSERVNRADFGYRMAEIFGLDPAIINQIRMDERSSIPPTPADVSLNSDKLFRAIGFRGRNVTDGLVALKMTENL